MNELGQIPNLKIDPLISPLSMNNSVNRSRLVHNIASDLHLSSVRLASRIFGDLQKVMSKRHVDTHDPNSLLFYSLLFLLYLLPPHWHFQVIYRIILTQVPNFTPLFTDTSTNLYSTYLLLPIRRG